jgi:ribosomal protein L11 methyltransferase
MISLSPRILLYPAGTPTPSRDRDTLVLAQQPGRAFGDGSHPTTRLCAGAVDLLCRQRSPGAVLDVGTGTGVLARIARARGVPFVAGTDIDPAALTEARTNAAFDTCAGELVFSDQAPDHWGARFDLVVANILEGPLHELAPALVRALRPGGTLLLSGFTRLQVPALEVTYVRAGLDLASASYLEDWALLALS